MSTCLVIICDDPVQQKVHLAGQVYSELMNDRICKKLNFPKYHFNCQELGIFESLFSSARHCKNLNFFRSKQDVSFCSIGSHIVTYMYLNVWFESRCGGL